MKALTAAMCFFAASMSEHALAQVTHWTNPVGGAFEDPGNWDNGVPGPTHDARFELPGTYTVTLNSDRTVLSLTQTAGDVTLDLGGLTLSGPTTIAGGTFHLTHGTLTRYLRLRNTATCFVESTATVRFTFTSTGPLNGVRVEDVATLVVRGTVTDCTVPQSFCSGWFESHPGTLTRIEGGLIIAEFCNPRGRVEIVGGGINHSGAGFSGGLDVNGGGIGGDNPTTLGPGISHIYGGAGISGCAASNFGAVSIMGPTIIEGANTRVTNLGEIRGAAVTVRGGAALIGDPVPGISILDGGSLTLGAGGTSPIKPIYNTNGLLRLEPGSTTYQIGFADQTSVTPYTSTLELVLDGASSPAIPVQTVSFWARRLGGTLRLEALNTNGLHLGDEIVLCKTVYGLFTGAFNQIIVPPLDGGRRIEVVMTNTDPENTRIIARIVADGTNPCWSSDFNGDGDFGTDADIEAFFACLGGTCCPLCGSADFNSDGDTGTDADIEAFFRVLGGSPC